MGTVNDKLIMISFISIVDTLTKCIYTAAFHKSNALKFNTGILLYIRHLNIL